MFEKSFSNLKKRLKTHGILDIMMMYSHPRFRTQKGKYDGSGFF